MGGPEKHIAEAEVEPIGKDVAVGNIVELVSSPRIFESSLALDADQIFRRTSRTRSSQTRSSKSAFRLSIYRPSNPNFFTEISTSLQMTMFMHEKKHRTSPLKRPDP